MATNNKKAAKPSQNAKSASGAKKAAPAKKAAKPVAKKPAPAKKAAKPAPKKAAIANKATKPVAKKVTKPAARKAAPAKKAAQPAPKKAKPIVKSAKNNIQKTVNKKKPAPIAKKATPAKKKEAPKKAAPAKKAAPVAKGKVTKAAVKPAPKAPAKPAAKAPAKPVAKAAPAKPVAKAPAKPAPVAKKAEPAKPAPAPLKKSTGKKKTLTLSQIPVKVVPGAPRPMATPAARPTEKKPTVIIAHRRMENKAKSSKNEGNTMIQYQPETYRSILDEPQEQQGPAYRYSDEDLNEFREIIVSRLDAARKELNYLQGLITRKDEAGTEDTENRYMNMEAGSGAMEREQLAQLASRQIQFMGHLEKALVRIENKTYGICRVTGKLIDKARLRAVPHATLSIEAKKMLASKQN